MIIDSGKSISIFVQASFRKLKVLILVINYDVRNKFDYFDVNCYEILEYW